MNRFVVLLLLLLAPLRPARAQPLPDRAPLAGAALDAKGLPVAGAFLTLRRKNDNGSFAFWGGTALTDAAGKWSFPDAEEGDYLLNVEAPGFAPIQNREVSGKADALPLQIRLVRLVDLTLQLRAPNGLPLANTSVFARLKPAGEGDPIQRAAVADGAGNLVVAGVIPGTYALYLRAPGSYAQIPLVIVGQDGAPVSLAVPLQKAGALRAILTDDRNRALGGATLTLTPNIASGGDVGEDFALLSSGGDRNALVTRDGDGTLDLDGLPPGLYTPRFFLPGYAPVSPSSVQIVAGQTAELKVQLPARETPTLTLDLRTQADKPYTAGEVTLRILPLANNGALGGDDGAGLPFFPGGPGGRRAVPDQNGRVTLFPVKIGRYRIFTQPRVQSPDQNVPDAAPVDVTITGQGATATVIMPGQ